MDENPSGLGVFDLPLRLPGQYFDKETNLHYNYYRDYDPGIGRYGESDPIGLRGGLNTYTYVNGQPIRFSDFLGLKSRVCCKRLGATFLAASRQLVKRKARNTAHHGEYEEAIVCYRRWTAWGLCKRAVRVGAAGGCGESMRHVRR